MKNIKILIILILIATTSYAQEEDTWTDKQIFKRVYKNSQKISDLFTNKNSKNGIGRYSYLNDKNQKVYELLKLDPASSRMKPYLTGKIDNLKIKTSYQRDSTTIIYEMTFTWNAGIPKDISSEQAKVHETYIFEGITDQVIKIVEIDFIDSKDQFYAWNEENNEEDSNKDLSFPQFLKIKRIAYLDEKSNKEVNIKDPEEKIIYALWTKNAFYRYAKNGLKDKVEFKERLDSTNSTPLNTILFYKDTNNKKRLYMNNYLEGEDNLYVSTIDVNPFPLESENPIIPFGTAIIWEKLNPSKKFLNLSIKLEFIGSKGFSHKEITNMEKETGLIKKMISDYQNENKSQ
jgi:hypothetical protein